MGIVNAERLNNFMSSPQWSRAQKKAAEDVLAGLERSLESRLSGAYITPRQCVEDAPILESGLVATRQVVQSVSSINGTAIAEGDPPPTGWVLDEGKHRLRWRPSTGSPFPPLPSTGVLAFAAPLSVTHVRSIGWVQLVYRGGWDNDSGLALAILQKARNIMINAHDDTVRTRGTDASAPESLNEDWTDEEIESLGTYRNLSAWR